jgi:hypothetical protein
MKLQYWVTLWLGIICGTVILCLHKSAPIQYDIAKPLGDDYQAKQPPVKLDWSDFDADVEKAPR